MWIFLVWLILAIVVGKYASNKGLSGVFYFFLSLVLSPLLGFLIAAVSKRDTDVIAALTGMKKCPDCAEYVQREANICRFCGRKFASVETSAVVSQEDQIQKEQEQIRQLRIAQNGRWAYLTIAVVVLVTAVFLLVHSTYIAIAMILIVTAVLLLAFYPQMKRPGPAAHV